MDHAGAVTRDLLDSFPLRTFAPRPDALANPFRYEKRLAYEFRRTAGGGRPFGSPDAFSRQATIDAKSPSLCSIAGSWLSNATAVR